MDLDGVWADFNTAFLRLLCTQTKRYLGPASTGPVSQHRPTAWNWMTDYGYTAEEIDAAWRMVEQPAQHWWQHLPPLHGRYHTRALLRELTGQPERLEVHFVTSRPGRTARLQSVAWLREHGVVDPSVLICADKGKLAAALHLHYLVDDHVMNIEECLMEIPTGAPRKAVLVTQPHTASWCRARQAVDSAHTRMHLEFVEPHVDGLADLIGRLQREAKS